MMAAAEYVPSLLLCDGNQSVLSRSILSSPTKSMSPADIVFANLSTAAENIAAAAVEVGDTLLAFEETGAGDVARAVEEVDHCVDTAAAICELMRSLFVGASAFAQTRPQLYENVCCLYQCSAWHFGPFRNSVIMFLTKPFARLLSSLWAPHHLSQLIPVFGELASCVVESFELQLNAIKDAVSAGAKKDDFEDLQKQVTAEKEDVRRKLIGLLVEISCYDEACSLAERFGDFEALVRVFARNRSVEMLEGWLEKHGREFAERLFTVLCNDPNGREVLMSLFVPSLFNEGTSLLSANYLQWFLEFLSSSDKYRLFKATYHLQAESGDKKVAAATFLELGLEEQRSLEKRRHLVSHSKLSALLLSQHSPDREQLLEKIRKDQHFQLYHDQLPNEVLAKAGYRCENLPVFPPRQLINFYVGPYNSMPNVEHFLHSLELLVLLVSVSIFLQPSIIIIYVCFSAFPRI